MIFNAWLSYKTLRDISKDTNRRDYESLEHPLQPEKEKRRRKDSTREEKRRDETEGRRPTAMDTLDDLTVLEVPLRHTTDTGASLVVHVLINFKERRSVDVF